MLKLQTDIATAVASALKVRLLGDEAARIELGGTRNPAAFDGYLRGLASDLRAFRHSDASGFQSAIDALNEAIRLDPNYALAYAVRSSARTVYAATGTERREDFARARADAERAVALAPDLGAGHLALGNSLVLWSLEFAQASKEYQRALALAPGDARTLDAYGEAAVYNGRTEAGIAAVHRAVVLDPLDPNIHLSLTKMLYYGRQYDAALRAASAGLNLDQASVRGQALLGLIYYALGRYKDASASCEDQPGYPNHVCLAVTYQKLGRHADAESERARMQATQGDAYAFQYAEVYAQWGDPQQALRWLDVALRLCDSGLSALKVDPLLDPLRKEARFQAIERVLKFAD